MAEGKVCRSCVICPDSTIGVIHLYFCTKFYIKHAGERVGEYIYIYLYIDTYMRV